MSKISSSRVASFTRMALAAATLAASMAVGSPALAAGYERGPDPTAAALDQQGPFELASFAISREEGKSYGYGGATVYYPKSSTQTFGVVTLTPGFLGFQLVYEPLAKKIASHGFVVINLDPTTIFDLPDVRAKEMAGAMKQVLDLAQAGKAPYASVMDGTRRAAVGHSMGGGGTLAETVLDHTLKAAVPLQPWHLTKSFSGDTTPTLVVACEDDIIAPNKQHSDVFYASLSSTLPRGEVEVKGGSHMCSTSLGNAQSQATVAKSTIAWLKRFVDDDARYDALVKGGINEGDYSRFDVQGF